jgi:hypothetical protein
VGTAGQNNVLTMIPARDVEEFNRFPAADMAFIKRWLGWTDTNLRFLRNTVSIAQLGSPAVGAVDGTASMDGDEGFLFLFNPGFLPLPANFTVDEAIGISNASSTDRWIVTELYPTPTEYVSKRRCLGNIICPKSHVRLLCFSLPCLTTLSYFTTLPHLTTLPCLTTLPHLITLPHFITLHRPSDAVLHSLLSVLTPLEAIRRPSNLTKRHNMPAVFEWNSSGTPSTRGFTEPPFRWQWAALTSGCSS